MAYNLKNGWTAGTLAPQSLGSRSPSMLQQPLPAPPPSAIGPINAMAMQPFTAERLMTQPTDLNNPSLGSRQYMNPLTGFRQVAAQTSVYNTPQAPEFLANAVNSLNAEQSLRRSAQSELVNRIIQGAASNDPNSYLWQESLRGAAVTPGAHVTFGSAVENPLIGQGYHQATQAYAQKTGEQAQAIHQARTAGVDINALKAKRQQLGNSAFGTYWGSDAQKLDQQITDAEANNNAGNPAQVLGQAAAGGNSGWFPTLPRY